MKVRKFVELVVLCIKMLTVSFEGVFQFGGFSENIKPIACLSRTSGVLDKQYLNKKHC